MHPTRPLLSLLLLLITTSTLAASALVGTPCMTTAQATQVASFWPALIGNYNATFAEQVLTADYTDYSESALSLNAECPQVNGTAPPLTAPVFTSRAQFEQGQGPQPPIDSEVLNIWNACSSVVLRYNMTNLGTRPVITMINMVTRKTAHGAKYPYRIATTYSEFDSSAWVSNLKDAGKC